ncbi:hypothetical protein [Arthrobacter sp. NEB 688]|uniref:P-loop ATPase, Sll1717 family n=1 Tax=Arthrobacter sp. NEB 688 TaxID=904039 RepID=UPI00156686E0|nr:hypothetical protein [Arthrobacter sp. NEB 688]QKE82879.1 hypothetical protein HL663_02215 [Arthrobacter sp. NEB 688]
MTGLDLNAVRDIVRSISMGSRVAEDERQALSAYFVETENWRKVFEGEVDVVFAPKGGGKSAIYSMLMSRESALFDRGILLTTAENPSGQTAFAEVEKAPPTSEDEFVGLWKTYFLALIAQTFNSYDINSPKANELIALLEGAELVKPDGTPKKQILHFVMDYVKSWFRPAESVEAELRMDPLTGIPIVKPKITFTEPTTAERSNGFVAIDDLLLKADEALEAETLDVWILLDRLDVAFASEPELEANALRALFRVYRDIQALDHLKLKIFLRSDIWDAITRQGFREASHITRDLRITWSESALMQLVVQRLLQSNALAQHYSVDRDQVLASAQAQKALFYSVYPAQIDQGSKKPATFDWCLTRTKDGTGTNAPRELIHLLSETKNEQLSRFEIGQATPEGHAIFDRQAFKDALPQVSEVRLKQTLYAEHPALRSYLELLEGQKTRHNHASLARLWSVSEEQAQAVSEDLVRIGFFEARGEDYWVPFMYRHALSLVQGSAEEVGTVSSDDD